MAAIFKSSLQNLSPLPYRSSIDLAFFFFFFMHVCVGGGGGGGGSGGFIATDFAEVCRFFP